ncbi:hypothetical protein FNU76_09815 [Chitinimonas arctica]|uniref:Surface-adhesin protein E-like domain-containing protein n=1 Tax=Chitinimonas arctica TaxID=2594795 RepID=A0A516SEP8_9NEIS|nr:surface-adhesin E family protein [Chitinimonas arctica]QDQ26636.1 hypothetical protein FNU76_09815 [Chitinimonas arctica]
MKAAALALLLTLGLAACGGSYMDTKNATKPEPVPEEKEGDWRLYGQQPGVEIKVSWASIGHDDRFGTDDYVYVWVQRAFKQDQTNKEGETYRTEFTRFALDCAKSEMAGIAAEFRDKDGDEVTRRDMAGFQWEFDSVTKQAYMQDFFTQVCRIAREKAAAGNKE